MIRILVVEDNLHNMRLVEQILNDIDERIQIQKAISAEEALGIDSEMVFDLVLMDISLSGANGIELTQVLKTKPQYANTPFIAVTAYALPSDIQKFKLYFEGYIKKPIDEQEFVNEILRWIGDGLEN